MGAIAVVTRGGGGAWLSTKEEIVEYFSDEGGEYSNRVEVVTMNDGEEFYARLGNFDFARTEYEESVDEFSKNNLILRIPHNTGYNSENFDKFVLYYQK